MNYKYVLYKEKDNKTRYLFENEEGYTYWVNTIEEATLFTSEELQEVLPYNKTLKVKDITNDLVLN
jgi:hypothetical protein